MGLLLFTKCKLFAPSNFDLLKKIINEKNNHFTIKILLAANDAVVGNKLDDALVELANTLADDTTNPNRLIVEKNACRSHTELNLTKTRQFFDDV